MAISFIPGQTLPANTNQEQNDDTDYWWWKHHPRHYEDRSAPLCAHCSDTCEDPKNPLAWCPVCDGGDNPPAVIL